MAQSRVALKSFMILSIFSLEGLASSLGHALRSHIQGHDAQQCGVAKASSSCGTGWSGMLSRWEYQIDVMQNNALAEWDLEGTLFCAGSLQLLPPQVAGCVAGGESSSMTILLLYLPLVL